LKLRKGLCGRVLESLGYKTMLGFFSFFCGNHVLGIFENRSIALLANIRRDIFQKRKRSRTQEREKSKHVTAV